MESAYGSFEPRGLVYGGISKGQCIIKEIAKLMAPINATEFASTIVGGSDIYIWLKRGFPAASLLTKNEQYFWFYHSAADSLLVANKRDLDKSVALFAAVAYIVADLSVEMPKDFH